MCHATLIDGGMVDPMSDLYAINLHLQERLGETQVVCNPGWYSRVEGHEFDPVFVVEL